MPTLNVADITVIVGYHMEDIEGVADVQELERLMEEKKFVKSNYEFITLYQHQNYRNHNLKTLILSEAGGKIITTHFLSLFNNFAYFLYSYTK